MSLPPPPNTTTLQDTRALSSLSPSKHALPPPHFSPGAHLDRNEVFAPKRPGDEADTRPDPRVAKKPKQSRRSSQVALAAPPPSSSSAPPPAAAAAAPVPSAPPVAPSPPIDAVGRFNWWLNAIRLPAVPPQDWPGEKEHWRNTANEELGWMKGEIKDLSDVLGEAWNQLRAPDPDEKLVKTYVERAVNIRRKNAGRGQATFPLVPTLGGSQTTTKDGKIILDLTLEDTPEPETPPLPASVNAAASQASAAPPARPPLPSRPSAPSGLKVVLQVPQPPLASPALPNRRDSVPPAVGVIRPPAVRAKIANPLARGSPTAAEFAQAKRVSSQPVIYGTEGFVLSPQLSASPFLIPPTATAPSLSPPLLPPGPPSSAPALQLSAAETPAPPPPLPPIPPIPLNSAVSSAAPAPQPAASSLPSSHAPIPSVLLPAAPPRQRTISREERQQPKVSEAALRDAATRAASEMYRDSKAAVVAEQRARQRSATNAEEYSPLRPALELPTLEPVNAVRVEHPPPSARPPPPSAQPRPASAQAAHPPQPQPQAPARTQPRSPAIAEQPSFANSAPPSEPIDEAQCYAIGTLQIPLAMTVCFLFWTLQYGAERTSTFIASWGNEIGLHEREIQAITTTLVAEARNDNPGWEEVQRRRRVSERHLERLTKKRAWEEEMRQRLAGRSLSAQQQQQALGVGTQQQQQQRQQRPDPRIAQAAALPGRGVPTVGDMVNEQTRQSSATQLALQQQQAQRDRDAQLARQPRRAVSGGSPALSGSPTFAASPTFPTASTFAGQASHVRRASDSQARPQTQPTYTQYQSKPACTSSHPPPSSSRPRTAEHAPAPPSQAHFGPSISPISPALSPHLPSPPIPPQRQAQPQQQQQPPVLPSPSPAEVLFAGLRPFLPAMQAFVTALDSGEIGRGGEELERRWSSRMKAIEEGEQAQEKGKQQLVGLGMRSDGSSVS